MNIKEIKSDKEYICEKIIRSLPQWFGLETAIKDYINGVKDKPMFIVQIDSDVIGFLSLKIHNQYTAEVYVTGVLSQYHRQKVGTRLLNFAEEYLKMKNFKLLTVKTLSESRPDEYYDKTRQFYLKSGFLPLEEFKTLWDEYNPCLMLLKPLK